ncbi:MAG TPA: hypothetical protein DDW52_15330 [Planctomycetaceae bacterium]|nr:hypothetical protein [Planctomycetaceae bacterium]
MATGASDMEVDEQLLAIESERLYSWLSRLVQGAAAIGGLAACVIAFGMVHHRIRMEDVRSHLNALGAEAHWEHQTFSRKNPKNTAKKAQTQIASVFGNSTVSSYSIVKIDHPSACDEQLAFLSKLTELKRLQLHSDSASDATLKVISRLPNLRILRLFGSRFSIHGLLNLREAPRLEELTIQTGLLTPIEMALLKSELPGVKVNQRQKSGQQPAQPSLPNYDCNPLPLARDLPSPSEADRLATT